MRLSRNCENHKTGKGGFFKKRTRSKQRYASDFEWGSGIHHLQINIYDSEVNNSQK